MQRVPVVVLDANILYPACLRNLFMYLARAGFLKARWTDAIHDEWIRNVIRDYPTIDPQYLLESRRLMILYAEESLVVGHEELISSLELPDADDRHVLAAAIHAQAAIIVTFNIEDFPANPVTDLHKIEVQHPDIFLFSLFQKSPKKFLYELKYQRASLKNPPIDVESFITRFESLGVTLLAQEMRRYKDLI